MSKHHEHSKHRSTLPPQTSEEFIVQVLERAETAGAKAGARLVKKELKNARRTAIELSELEVTTLLAAAQQSGAEAALAAAQRSLEKFQHTKDQFASGTKTALKAYEGEPQTVQSSIPRFGQHLLTVKRIEQISPEMRRVVAGATQLAGFKANKLADQYVKVFFADPCLGLHPPYDLKELRRQLPRDQVPRTRSYTIRWVDSEAEELAIDFLIHDNAGPGSLWASTVEPGDPLVISAARGKFRLSTTATNYIFAADETGIPAVSVALGMLRSDATGIAMLEVSGPASELEIEHPAGIELRWIHRDSPRSGANMALAQAFSFLDPPAKNSSVMVHAERATTKAISHMVDRWDLPRDDVHISSYWTLRTKHPQIRS